MRRVHMLEVRHSSEHTELNCGQANPDLGSSIHLMIGWLRGTTEHSGTIHSPPAHMVVHSFIMA